MTIEQLSTELRQIADRLDRLKKHLPEGKPHQRSVGEIISHVCNAMEIPERSILSANLRREVAVARWLSMRLFFRKSHNLKATGRAFGRDHSAVAYGLNRLKEMMEIDPQFKAKVEEIERGFEK